MADRTPQETYYQCDESKRVLARQYENAKLAIDVFSETIVPIVASLFLIFSGTALALSRSLWFTDSYWFSVAIFLVVFVVFLQVVETPFAFYSGFMIDHKFGLSTQRVKDWTLDVLKSAAIESMLGVLVGIVLYYLILVTEYWWLVAAALFAVFSILLSVILPYLIMPIFYKVTPLADSVLRDSVLEMVRRVETKNINRVLVADESRRSVRANAMFSGIGHAKAIVLFDTLTNNFTRREVRTVVAHELGHYVNKDIWKLAILSGILSVPSFFIADYTLRRSIVDFGFTSIADPAGFPIIFAILVAVNFLLQPVSNGLSRAIERQADEFALRAADDADAQASAERRLADMNLSVDTPNRLVELFFYTHPSSSRRVRLAEEWKRREARTAIRP